MILLRLFIRIILVSFLLTIFDKRQKSQKFNTYIESNLDSACFVLFLENINDFDEDLLWLLVEF